MLKTDKFIILDENNTEILSKTSNSKSSKDQGTAENLKLHLSELKSKFDNLNINYEEVFDFYKKVSSKQSFYKNVMMNYNIKQINLESQKDNYSKRINFIIKKQKNMNDFMNSNSKIEIILKRFLQFSETIQTEKKYEFEYLQSQNNKDFYKKCELLINIIKSFFEFIITL